MIGTTLSHCRIIARLGGRYPLTIIRMLDFN